MDSTEMKELHFEHLQRVTAAIGAWSVGCGVSWNTSASLFVLFNSLPKALHAMADLDNRKLSTLTG
jgi:hypothetical protein